MADLAVDPARMPARECSAVRLSTIGVSDLDASLRFYRDVLGLTRDVETSWSGPEFERHWRLPAGVAAQRAAVLSAFGRVPGRVLLLEFAGAEDHDLLPKWFLGYNNINVYTTDMAGSVATLLDHGYQFWSDPLKYQIGEAEGSPTEVFFDGPDGIAVNVIEPVDDPTTVVGRVGARYAEIGATPTGFSEVPTSGHSVASIEDALHFYCDILGLEVLMDFEVSGPARNHFLALPPDALSRNTFLFGDDLFGKIALCEALNHVIPQLPDEATTPPGIGYFAMSFAVRDLGAVLASCRESGVVVWTEPVTLQHPAFGEVETAIVRVPGSGALAELIAGR